MHTCRKWRHSIVYESQQALYLRLFCTHGTPVLKSLYCWPALPIVVHYGGSLEEDLPTPEDEDNIMAALKQPHRVISISLIVTRRLQERLSTIESPFLNLEHLVLLSRDRERPLIKPIAFRSRQWGTRLRTLHLIRIAVLGLPKLLCSSRNLVDLQLHEVLYPLSFSTEALTVVLLGMTQLRSLSLHFLPSTYHFSGLLLSRERVAFPSLTHFDFRGIPKVLKGLVARFDAPRLGDIEVTFDEYNSDSDLSSFIEFVDRIKMHQSPRRADILYSEHDIDISLHPGAPTCLRIKLELPYKPFIMQLSSMALLCIQFSAFLLNVEDLRISVKRQSRQDNGPYDDQLLKILLDTTTILFIGVKRLQVSGNLSKIIVNSLQLRNERGDFVLPALHKLYVLQPGPCNASLREAIVSLMTSRRLSGHSFTVDYEKALHRSELGATGTVYNQ